MKQIYSRIDGKGSFKLLLGLRLQSRLRHKSRNNSLAWKVKLGLQLLPARQGSFTISQVILFQGGQSKLHIPQGSRAGLASLASQSLPPLFGDSLQGTCDSALLFVDHFSRCALPDLSCSLQKGVCVPIRALGWACDGISAESSI